MENNTCPKGGTCELEVGLDENGKQVSRCKKCGKDMSVEVSVGVDEINKQ